jgi:hypothetical protein
LSRACLGKMIGFFLLKWLKNTVFYSPLVHGLFVPSLSWQFSRFKEANENTPSAIVSLRSGTDQDPYWSHCYRTSLDGGGEETPLTPVRRKRSLFSGVFSFATERHTITCQDRLGTNMHMYTKENSTTTKTTHRVFCFVLFCFVLAGGRHAHRPAFAAGHLPNRHLLLRNLATGRHAARRKQWRGDIAPRCGDDAEKRNAFFDSAVFSCWKTK